MNSRVLVCQIRSAGYTQQDIAEKIGGLSQRTVAYWQRGKEISPAHLAPLRALRNRLQAAGRVKLSEYEAELFISLADRAGMHYEVKR